jgi:hypothetical protein
LSTLPDTASDKVYQLPGHGWWFSPGTPASSTTKNGLDDIAEILLKVALNAINQNTLVIELSTLSALSTLPDRYIKLTNETPGHGCLENGY